MESYDKWPLCLVSSIWHSVFKLRGFSCGSDGKESACNDTRKETRVRSLGREDPLEKEMQPTPVFSLEKSHGQRSLMGYSPWGHKESDTTEQLSMYINEGIVFRKPGWREFQDRNFQIPQKDHLECRV